MNRRGKVPVLDGREGCSTRCLPPEAAKAARERIGEDEIRRVPFTCQVSREPATAVLIGEATAGRLLAAGPGLLRTEAEARALLERVSPGTLAGDAPGGREGFVDPRDRYSAGDPGPRTLLPKTMPGAVFTIVAAPTELDGPTGRILRTIPRRRRAW